MCDALTVARLLRRWLVVGVGSCGLVFALFGVRWCCWWLGGFSWFFSCLSCAWCVFAFCFSCCVWLSRFRGGSFSARSRLGGVLDREKRKSLKKWLVNGLLWFRPARCVASSEKTKEKRQAVKPAVCFYSLIACIMVCNSMILLYCSLVNFVFCD